jgi:hypothetical protein
MKFLTQIVLPVVIVMALIGGVTFLSHYAGSRSKISQRGTALIDLGHEAGGAFDLDLVGGGDGSEEDGPPIITSEINSRGYQDYWFRQASHERVEIGLQSKNSVCSHVSVMQVSHDKWKEVNRLSAGVASLRVGEGHAGPLSVLAATALGGQLANGQWHRGGHFPELDDQGLPVSPAASPDRPNFCVVRLHWQSAMPGPMLVKADLWSQKGDHRRRIRSLEQRVLVVPGLQVAPTWTQFKDLTAKGQRESVTFTCWSPTRSNFSVKPRDFTNHSAFAFTTEPLTEIECRNVALAQKSAVRSGYRVSVAVTESEQLDLGPFSRQIILESEVGDKPLTVQAFGVVRGSVQVGTPAEPDIIDLGDFPSRKGTVKSVPVVLQGAEDKLTVDSWAPDYLEVKLEPRPAEQGAQRWELLVRAPGGAVVGKLPGTSTVFLKVQGATPRRLRIPILGQGTQ